MKLHALEPRITEFRQDINGLRAWAVMAVILYHFHVSLFDGGFVGVDIFFVISGFLMTAIIVKRLEAGSFSIFNFYLARAQRIVPALAAMCSVLLILGWFYLPTADYQILGTQAAYALTFLSNLRYWRSAGYFDSVAEEKWLLHTWSLSVEWQFYILFPLLLVLLWRLRSTHYGLWAMLLGLTIVSFLINLWLSYEKPVAAFYLLPGRTWEMTAGGLIYLWPHSMRLPEKWRGLVHILSWCAIILALIVSEGQAWPGISALLPVIGTCGLIYIGANNSIMIRSKLVQWLGLRSYSIYLWHWPLVVGLHYVLPDRLVLWTITLIMLSVLLGHLSYHLVENSMRRTLRSCSKFTQLSVFILIIGGVSASGVAIRSWTFTGRIPAVAEIAAAELNNGNLTRPECFDNAGINGSPGCIYGNKKILALF